MINRCLNALILMTGVFLQLPCQAAYDVDFGKAMGITHANPFATDEVEYAPHDLLEADKMTYTAEDFNIAGKGRGADLNLSFIRYYTNENSAKGVCGHGWSTCLDVTLQFVGMLVDAVILDEKGEMFTFSVNGTDTWEPKSEPNPHRFYKQQINPETFYYIFERKYGNKYYFDSTFLLLEKITDRNGNTIVYNRDPETNLITSIEDNSGRQIQFTYDSFRKTVLTVTGPDNRTFHYYYNSILDNLIQVTDPENNSTFFEYTHYNVHNITKIITPNGNYQAFNYGIEKLSEIFQGPHLISTISCFEAGEIKNVQMQNPVGFTATRNILKTYDTNPPTTTITSTDNTGTETDILDKYGYEWKYTDKKGRYTVMTRDIRGNVLSMRNAKGYTTTQTFSALNKPLVMTSPLSLVERFIYDAKGNLIQYTNGEGGIYTLSYDANGLPLTFTDPNNKTETYEYDSYGNMTKVTDSETGVKEFSYDLYGNCIREKDERGYETFFEYDRMNRLKKTTFPDLSTRVLTYDGNGNVLTTQDENGNETVFTYNEWDKKATVRDAEGNIRSFTYDAIGRLSAVTDGNNQVWTYEYDVLNNLTKKTFPDESFIRYEFDIQSSSKMVPSAGVKPKNVTDAMGAVTNFQYDEMYALFKETDALQKTTTFIHDSLDRIITYRDKLGKNYNMTYNKLNKVTSAQNPLGYVSSTVYDKMGQVLSKTDSNGKTVSYTYDGEGRVKTVTNALSQTVSYSYDAEGNVISITDAKNNSVNYEYDSRGRVSKERDALGNESRVFYDNAGNIVRKVRPDNTEVLYTYYRNNLLKTISYPAAGKTVSFEYDGNNNPVKMTDWLGETNYVYDSRNRLTEITEPTGRKIRYEYDANGRRTALKLLNDGVSEAYRLNYTYDVLNRLTRIADSSNAFVNFTYDALGRRILQEYSNGVKAAFVYNDISFLTRIRAVNSGNGVIMQLDYTHDKAGNILSETEQGGLTKTYSYDSIYQLLGVGYSDGTSCAFSYDAAGNRLSKTENGISTTYTYNNLNQLTQALENGVQTDFVYDLNGNLLQETNANQIMTYGYNFLNKVASINKVTATENITLSMVYNSEGKRISKAYSTGETWNYVYDGQNVLQEQNGGNTSFYLPGGLDELLVKTTNGVKEFLINDRLNSLRKVTNASQSVTASLTYKPFGELLSGDPGSQHYLYTGREKDFDSVYFYRNRTFNPVHGVFQQSDPIGITAGLNLYSYVGNNPIRLTDPMGLCVVDAWAELMDALDDLFSEFVGDNDLSGARNALQNATGGPDPTQMGGGYSSGGGGGSLPGTGTGKVPAISITTPANAPTVQGRAVPGYMESKGKGKAVVIGETMSRVKAAAKKLGAKWWQAWKMKKYNPDLSMKRNIRWIEGVKRQNIKVYDIGRDSKRVNNPSDNYTMESKATENYPNLEKIEGY